MVFLYSCHCFYLNIKAHRFLQVVSLSTHKFKAEVLLTDFFWVDVWTFCLFRGVFFLFVLFYKKLCNAAFAERIKLAEKLSLFRALCFLQLALGRTNAFPFFNCISAGNFFPVKGLHLSGAVPVYGIGLKCYCDCDLRRADTNLSKNTWKMRG